MPKIINVLQGSDQWHELRSNHIGASLAGAIMDCDIYRTKYEIWLQMIGIGEKQKEHGGMTRGKVLEAEARTLYEQFTGLIVSPRVLQSDREPFMIASSDGMTGDLKNGCEIKCLSLEDHDKQQIFPMYYAQIQHHIFVSELQEFDYVGYHPQSNINPLYIIPVKRDEEFLMDYIPKAKTFYNCVQTFTSPELLPRDYRNYAQNPDYRAAEAAYVDICDKLDKLEEQKEQVRVKLLDMSEGNNIQGAYTKLTNYVRKGNIDYSKIPELSQIDLELYRKPVIKSSKITKV